jgi:hypothetical protein
VALMSIPTGRSPETAEKYYLYLQGHQETTGRVQTWHVDWMSLAWLWGFAIALAVVTLLWIWQYRTTRQPRGVYPVDNFGGYTTELAGPASRFFLLLTAILTAFATAIVVGHLVWGQKF